MYSSKPPCAFYGAGRCRFGRACRFEHIDAASTAEERQSGQREHGVASGVPEEAVQATAPAECVNPAHITAKHTPCRFFRSEAGCRYGSACLFRHDEPGGSGLRGDDDPSHDVPDAQLCNCVPTPPLPSMSRDETPRGDVESVTIGRLEFITHADLLRCCGLPTERGEDVIAALQHAFGAVQNKKRKSKKQGARTSPSNNTALEYYWSASAVPLSIIAEERDANLDECVFWKVRVSVLHARCQLSWLESSLGLVSIEVRGDGIFHYAPYQAGKAIAGDPAQRLWASSVYRRAHARLHGTAVKERKRHRPHASGTDLSLSERDDDAESGEHAPPLSSSLDWSLEPTMIEHMRTLAVGEMALGESYSSIEEMLSEDEDDEEDDEDDVMSDDDAEVEGKSAFAAARERVSSLQDPFLVQRNDWEVWMTTRARLRLQSLFSFQHDADGTPGRSVETDAVLDKRGPRPPNEDAEVGKYGDAEAGKNTAPIYLEFFARTLLESSLQWSELAQQLFRGATAGCGHTAQLSEVLSLEVLHSIAPMCAAQGENDVHYRHTNCSLVDFICQRDGVRVGVSVTRAFDRRESDSHEQFHHKPFGRKAARRLLLKKLHGLEKARSAVSDRHAWAHDMLVVWSATRRAAKALELEWNDMHHDGGRGNGAPSAVLLIINAHFPACAITRSFVFSSGLPDA